jgi:hypothetical protein
MRRSARRYYPQPRRAIQTRPSSWNPPPCRAGQPVHTKDWWTSIRRA